MSSDTLLTELCSICYTNKPKYRCPRCKTQTCSLPCSKKHKQRASCSGVRNPAEFVKKSQLATPSGVDRDYNYLKGVERSIDVASREASDRGIGKNAANHRVFRGNHPESIVQKYLAANRITMHRAPTGMSRQKANQTRASKRNHILWTVEWIDADGLRNISNDCLESDKLRNLYAATQVRQNHASKRRPGESERAASKRRRLERKKMAETEQQAETASSEPQRNDDVAVEIEEESESAKLDIGAGATAGGEQGSSSAATQQCFYLLRPGTSSTNKVLIPVDADTTLTATLRDKTVLEFPTIYVLPHAAHALPSGYMLEEAYLGARKKEDAELRDAVRTTVEQGGFASGSKRESEASHSDAMDPNKILSMLKRDITR
ncbi:putative box C/D snoRNA protein [Pseudocercospora fuligena]|uniref:Box C/D snoRNA protein 1 n=1 Tax=Pseudocercospora fuligena TaxID=685502 RepID=A0A8H6RSF4_9PEZI|nr:putative box C/D snoRNA protein [Pseudocercospora fuligena]